MKIYLLAILGVAALASCEGPPRVYCGRHLASVMAYICDQSYLVKRSHYTPYVSLQAQSNIEDERWGWRRGKRHGIVDECCEKSCTEDELIQYC